MKRFVEEGVEVALKGKKGSCMYNKKAGDDFEAHLVAFSFGEQSEGFLRRSIRSRLLAEKVIELKIIF